MSDTSIIKEFLVALGYKADDAALKKFQTGIDKATKFVGKLALGVEAMAVATDVAIVKVSQKFEDLYYASQRMSDSVEAIRGTTFAIGQMGGTASGAMAALENLGEFFRSNPGAERWVQGLGVATRQANGELRGMTGIMHDLGAAFRAMPYYRAKVVANQLGIDPRTLQAMLRDTGEAQSRASEIFKRMGVDQDKAALASKNFMNDFRELVLVLTVGLDKIILAVQPTFDRIVRWLEDLDVATDGWSTKLIALGAIVGPLLLFLDPLWVALAGIAFALTQADWSAWAAPIAQVAPALRDLLNDVKELTTSLSQLANSQEKNSHVYADDAAKLRGWAIAFKVVIDMADALVNTLNVIVDLLTGKWTKAWADTKKLGLDLKDPKLAEMLHAPAGAVPGATPRQANDNTPSQSAAGVAQGVGAKVQAFFEAHGFNKTQAAGVTAGVGAESQFKSDAFNSAGGGNGAYGLGQWRGPRLAELRRRYGSRPTIDQQLEFMLWEMTHSEAEGGRAIQSATTSAGALQAYIRQFMRPGSGTAGDLKHGLSYLSSGQYGGALASAPAAAGGKAVTFHQKTEVTVQGGGDPHATAKAVAGEQHRVNDAVARQLKVAAS